MNTTTPNQNSAFSSLFTNPPPSTPIHIKADLETPIPNQSSSPLSTPTENAKIVKPLEKPKIVEITTKAQMRDAGIVIKSKPKTKLIAKKKSLAAVANKGKPAKKKAASSGASPRGEKSKILKIKKNIKKTSKKMPKVRKTKKGKKSSEKSAKKILKTAKRVSKRTAKQVKKDLKKSAKKRQVKAKKKNGNTRR